MGFLKGRVFPAAALTASLAAGAHAQAGGMIAKLNIIRDVLVSRAAIRTGIIPEYRFGRQGQGVFDGQGVRTLKRSRAEVVFSDRSALRINERTDLIVRDEATLRRIQLQAGAVWLRVARGTNTQVETPIATAVARGTEFTVTRHDDGSVTLTVYRDTVELQIPGRPTPYLVKEGQTVTVRPSDGAPDSPSALSPTELPESYGGTRTGWWESLSEDAGLMVAAGTDALYAQRTSVIGEAGQTLQMINDLGASVSSAPLFLLSSAAERRQFISVAQQTLLSDFKNSALTLSAYQTQFGSQSVFSRFTFDTASTALLNRIGIKTVDDFIQAIERNGAGLNLSIDSSRLYYRPQSLKGTPNYDLRLLDRAESSGWFVGVGAAAALLANYAQNRSVTLPPPVSEFSLGGYAGSPHILTGGRANVKGRVNTTRYEFEANLLSLIYGDPQKTNTRLFSVAVVNQKIAPGVRLYAGRRRFYHGPTFLNQNLSQLIAERYDGAGVTLKQGPLSFDGGFVYDANPDAKRAQSGAVASALYQYGDGQYGLHYLRSGGLRDGNGVSVSGAYRLIPQVIEAYGEFGRGPDRAMLYTIGAHLPGVYEASDVDIFAEYGYHQGISHSLTLTALRDVRADLSLRAFLDFAGSDRGVTGGLAIVFRQGN